MDAIIFDVDGTLWDATPVAAAAWNDTLKTYTDLPPNVDVPLLKKLFGQPMDVIAAAIFKGLPPARQEELGLLTCERENELLLSTHKVPLYPGVPQALRALSKKYPLFIVSNCQAGYIEALIQTNGISPYIKGHLCYGDTNLPKDQTLRILMEKYGLEDVLYVGDTAGDEEACKKAGIPFAYVSYGYGTAQEPLYRVDSLGELEELLSGKKE